MAQRSRLPLVLGLLTAGGLLFVLLGALTGVGIWFGTGYAAKGSSASSIGDTGAKSSSKSGGSSSGSSDKSSSDKSSSPSSTPLKAGEVSTAKPATGASSLILKGTKSGPPPIEPGITPSQCNDLEDGGPVSGPDCFSGTLECGQTIIGHTKGGVDRFNTRFYEANFCWPGTINRNGGDERMYRFKFPDDGKWIGRVTLDTPCADLDVVAMTWNKSTCPTGNSQVAECDSQRKGGTTREHADLISDGKWVDWAIVVEGIGDEEGPFALTVQCKEGLMWY